jgi:hypothetical protein
VGLPAGVFHDFVVPGPVLPDLAGIFESRGPLVHKLARWPRGGECFGWKPSWQLQVPGSQFGGAIYRSDGVRTSASGASELSQDAALA